MGLVHGAAVEAVDAADAVGRGTCARTRTYARGSAHIASMQEHRRPWPPKRPTGGISREDAPAAHVLLMGVSSHFWCAAGRADWQFVVAVHRTNPIVHAMVMTVMVHIIQRIVFGEMPIDAPMIPVAAIPIVEISTAA